MVLAVSEKVWKQTTSAKGVQVAAYTLLFVAFLLTLLPANWYDIILKKIHIGRQEKDIIKRIDQMHMTPRQRLRSTTGHA